MVLQNGFISLIRHDETATAFNYHDKRLRRKLVQSVLLQECWAEVFVNGDNRNAVWDAFDVLRHVNTVQKVLEIVMTSRHWERWRLIVAFWGWVFVVALGWLLLTTPRETGCHWFGLWGLGTNTA